MKALLVIFVTIVSFFTQSYGQINPIGNLNWDHYYVFPNNFYSLTWNAPEQSQDTLIGYNIYRQNELYRFQTETNLSNPEYGGGNCNEDFLVLEEGGAFWIHVTAVYNAGQQESIYEDSVYCMGYAINIEEPKQMKLQLYPNPTSGLLKFNNRNIKEINVIDLQGHVVETFEESSLIDIRNLPKGTYFIKINTPHEEFTEKVLLR